MEITSPNNEKIKEYQKLKQKKYRDQTKLFLVEDDHLVKEALASGLAKEIITSRENEYDVPTIHVPEKIMKLLSSQVTSAKVIAVCHHLEEKEIMGNILILDNLQDPGNLGTIIRSAVAFNFKNIVLSNDSVDLYNDKVIRASEGMFFHLNILRRDLKEFLSSLSSNYTKITTDVTKGEDIKDVKCKDVAIVIGNEGSGVSKEVSSLCDKCVHLKMNEFCESLNAGVCASILMYEVNHE